MLRITTDENPRVITLRLEGRLEGPWVAVLDNCWRSALASRDGKGLCVDLASVTFIDSAAKVRLAQMHRQGAELVAGDVETKSILAEILSQ